MPTRRVVVVGGGISGLTVAHALTGLLASGDVEIELREAGARWGGALRTTPFAGRPAVDEGADAYLVRTPAAANLARRVGLTDALTSPIGAPAAVWHDRLHPIPDGLVLGVPSGPRSIVRLARAGLLSGRGLARAALEPLLPRRDHGDSVGRLVRARFGHEVHERLVDALIGSIYGTDTDHFSLAMVPQLAGLADGHRSLLLAARAARARASPTTGPLFEAPLAGMGALAVAVADAARAGGARLLTDAAVTDLGADGRRWRVDGEPADAVVLATPAAATAPLVAGVAPDAASVMATMEHAGVAIVTLAVPDWPERLHDRSGYLVPKPVQRTVTAASFGSQKWSHWRGDGEVLRISLGRDGLPIDHLADEELVARAVEEVGTHLALDLGPTAARVSRWPAAFPQYRPHHPAWIAAVESGLPPGLVVTGASYHGVGVPACVAHAEATAARVADHLARTE